MCQLDTWNRALALNEGCDPAQVVDLIVVPQTEIGIRNASLGFHGSSFRNHQPCTAHRAATQMNQVPIVRKSIFARIFAHRRDGDPIRERDTTDRKWREEVWARRFRLLCVSDNRFGCPHI